MGQTTSQNTPDLCSPEPTSTTNWFDLPLEMREIVIDKMDAKTRCKFAKCSKMCEKEAKSSKNYMQWITVMDEDTLEMSHTGKRDYKMTFLEINENRTLVCYVAYIDGDKDNRDVKWTKVEYGNNSEVRSKYFKEYLRKYKHSVRFLKVADETFSIMDHNLKHIKCIKRIMVPHKDVFKCGYLNPNQVLQSDFVALNQTNFTFEEIIRFKGIIYTIKSDDFNEETIIKYLKMWKNAKLPVYIYHLFVTIPREVDMRRIMEELDGFHYKEDENEFKFRFYAEFQIGTEYFTQIKYIFPTFFIAFCEQSSEDNEEGDDDVDDEDDE